MGTLSPLLATVHHQITHSHPNTTVEITPDQPLDFHWEGHGFKVHIPAGAIRRERGRVTLCIQASLSGDYQLPDDGVLVSGVYWLSLHPHVERFEKEVTIGIKHCASNKDSELSFIMAKTTNGVLSTKLLGMSFSSKMMGFIKVTSFCRYSIINKTSQGIIFYSLKVHYSKWDDEVRITVTQNLDLHLIVR